MRLHKMFVAAAILALSLCAAVVVIAGSGLARTLMALCLVFILPGVSILTAWFPRHLGKAPDNILLTITLSLATTAISGIMLNFLPWGLQPQIWGLWLGGVAVFNAEVALLRNLRHPEVFAVGNNWTFRLPQVIMLILAGVLTFGAIALARAGVTEQSRPGFTQLWMIQTDKTNTVRLGVQNEEQTPVTYWLVVRQDGQPLQAYYDLEVAAGDKWETTLQLQANPSDPVEADLYRTDIPQTAYRSVTLWLSNDES
jgi:uncharacterized membrane protein